MTENEKMSISGLLDVLNTGISLSTCHMEYAIQSNVLEDMISCLEELEQYRAIGKVEDFKALKEKNEPKQPDYEGDGCWDGHVVIDTWICPSCGKSYEVDYDDYDYCPNCGQHIDHSGLTEDD